MSKTRVRLLITFHLLSVNAKIGRHRRPRNAECRRDEQRRREQRRDHRNVETENVEKVCDVTADKAVRDPSKDSTPPEHQPPTDDCYDVNR